MMRPNGAGVMALLAADILTTAGHEVVVLGGGMKASLAARLDDMHFAAAGFTNNEKALEGSVTSTDHRALIRSFRAWLDHQLETHSPDVLYVHNCGRILSQLDLVDLSKRLPVAHTMHDEWFYTDAHYKFRPDAATRVLRTFEPGRSASVLEHRYGELFEIPGRVGTFTAIGPSRWLTERARRVFPSLNIVHLPNAVDTSLFDLQNRADARNVLGLPADRSVVLFVGNPTQRRKGFAALERAIQHLSNSTGEKPIRLIAGGAFSGMVGDVSLAPGPLATHLERESGGPMGTLDIDGDAIAVSGLDRSLMPALYGAANVLVHPSIIDNLPTVPIEAGLCGTRCLASNVGGTAETIVDTADLFAVDTSAATLGARIGDAIQSSHNEQPADREQRRSVQLERFGLEAHKLALLAILEDLRTAGVAT